MGRISAAARKAKAASSQVAPAQVPLPSASTEGSTPVEDTPESVQSVTNTGTEGEENIETDGPEDDPAAAQPIAASSEQPGDDLDHDGEQKSAHDEPSLDEDPTTAPVGNIYLHLLSEHACYEGLLMDDDAAIAMHAELHEQNEFEHPVEDWRFRPAKALAVSLRDVLATAAVSTRDPDTVCVP